MKKDAIILFKDESDYLWCLANENCLDYTGTRYKELKDVVVAAKAAFPGLPFMSSSLNAKICKQLGIKMVEYKYL